VKNTENLIQPSTLPKWLKNLPEYEYRTRRHLENDHPARRFDAAAPEVFDYRAEDATRADIGYRVLVPFGKKRLVGVIWDVATKSKVNGFSTALGRKNPARCGATFARVACLGGVL